MNNLYRLVYTSKNLLRGNEAEVSAAVAQILEASQRNNAAAEVTGALMFNGSAFAQVLEGPRPGVEQTFERIQRDGRHSDVTVLQCAPVERRGFENWSMAFVGQSARGRTLWSSLATESGFELSRMSGDGIFSMLHDLVLDEEAVSSNTQPAPANVMPLHLDSVQPQSGPLLSGSASATETVDTAVGKPLRPAQSQKESASARTKAAGDTIEAVLRASLAAERQLTTTLREELDELRIELGVSRSELATVEQERDLWVERARVLAAAMCKEADEVRQRLRATPERPEPELGRDEAGLGRTAA